MTKLLYFILLLCFISIPVVNAKPPQKNMIDSVVCISEKLSDRVDIRVSEFHNKQTGISVYTFHYFDNEESITVVVNNQVVYATERGVEVYILHGAWENRVLKWGNTGRCHN